MNLRGIVYFLYENILERKNGQLKMCGRLACGLLPEQIRDCCCYKKTGSDKFVRPEWKDITNRGKKYEPSYNICPTEAAPVLLCGSHFSSDSRLVTPMAFGLIPSWSKKVQNDKYSTINCRIETVKTSKLYASPLRKGQRCVVICQGFYEWKPEKNCKKPYFVYGEQLKGVSLDDPNTWHLDFTEDKGFNGIRTLKLAALFDACKSDDEEEKIFSFSIITKEASSEMTWLHHRMPAIIETEEQLNVWLNHKEYDENQALQCLLCKIIVIYRPVSNWVNKTANKDVSCIREPPGKGIVQGASAKLLKNWLHQAQKRKANEVMIDSVKMKKEEGEN